MKQLETDKATDLPDDFEKRRNQLHAQFENYLEQKSPRKILDIALCIRGCADGDRDMLKVFKQIHIDWESRHFKTLLESCSQYIREALKLERRRFLEKYSKEIRAAVDRFKTDNDTESISTFFIALIGKLSDEVHEYTDPRNQAVMIFTDCITQDLPTLRRLQQLIPELQHFITDDGQRIRIFTSNAELAEDMRRVQEEQQATHLAVLATARPIKQKGLN